MNSTDQAVVFESDYSLEESVRRLSSVTCERSLFGSKTESLVGRVSESRVQLVREIPYLNNSFKPVFSGRFEQNRSKVTLTGSFQMHTLVRIFSWLWLALLAAFSLFATIAIAIGSGRRTGDGAWQIPLACVGMAMGGCAIFWFGRWLARNDRTWISNTIQSALSRSR